MFKKYIKGVSLHFKSSSVSSQKMSGEILLYTQFPHNMGLPTAPIHNRAQKVAVHNLIVHRRDPLRQTRGYRVHLYTLEDIEHKPSKT